MSFTAAHSLGVGWEGGRVCVCVCVCGDDDDDDDDQMKRKEAIID